MRLIDIMMYNFMPYKGENRISFPRDPAHNVMLIYGDNMRGKTCFLNAIRWALYGRVLGRHLKVIDPLNIINIDAAQEGDWRTAVHLKFEADGDMYDLRREMRLRNLVVNPKTSNDFDIQIGLTKNGSPLRPDQIPHEINLLMPEQISRFFLFDGELLQEYEMLLIEESTQGERIKGAIEQVLGVPALRNGRDELRTLLKRAQAAQARETRHIAGLKSLAEQQLHLQNEIRIFDTDRQNLAQKVSEIQTEIDRLDDDLSNTEAAQKYQIQMDTNKSERDRLINQQKELVSEKLEVLRDAWKDLLQPRLQAHIYSIEQSRDSLRKSIEHRGALVDRVNKLKSLIHESVCPTCQQLILPEQRDRFGAELGKMEAEVIAITADLAKLNGTSSEIAQIAQIRSTGAANRLEAVEKQLRQISVSLTKTESEIENIKEKIKGYDTAEISRKRALRDAHLTNIGRFKDDIRRVDEKISANTKKQDQLAKLMSKNPEARIQKGSRQVEVYTMLEEIFGLGIEELRENLRTRVADLATGAFKELTTESTYNALKINENYGLSIIDGQGRQVVVRSAGAEQIVAFSLIDGLNRTAGKRGPIVMDTPFGRLDPRHRNRVLSYLPKMADQVILLVHEGEVRKDVDLKVINDRVGSVYQIERISSSQSRLVRN